ncbi:hypothetical protein LR48_Vigan03g284200 [Vigna angularis]|uniref:UDP-glucuronate decarboxylase n=1 Tax=Phaseolus angularis TaxID=3914 RepID=A0A0L9U9D2_PHAAN|nr:hypothetical protein LR48_Vigan03g284200 [Vigna angularis]
MASGLVFRGHEAQPVNDAYSAKPQKPWFSLRYFFREQRLHFLFFGILLASVFFLLFPSLSSPPVRAHDPLPASLSARHDLTHWITTNTRAYDVAVHSSGRIPLGIKRKVRRVVVTGGAGFVGSHLVDRLISRGDSVIVVDNFFTGRKENVMHHFGNPSFELIRHDVVEPLLLEVDQIYHLACPASPVHYKFNPVKTIISFRFLLFNSLNCILFVLITTIITFNNCLISSPMKMSKVLCTERTDLNNNITLVHVELDLENGILNWGSVAHKTNVVGTLNMLGLAKRVGARFLLTSTSEVYGDPLQHPQKETYWGNVNPIGFRSSLVSGSLFTTSIATIETTEILIVDGGRPVRNGWLVLGVIGKEGALTANLQSYNVEGSAPNILFGVRSCYDEGKRTAETLTMDYHRGAGVEVRIARIFNTYGPRMCLDDGRVVSNFVAQALRKEALTVYGDGKQTRSFQYVSDLVEGLMRLMEGEHVGPFNLGNPGEFTMLELAKVVQETIDPEAKIDYRPNTEDDPHMRKPDISRAKELLGWEPKVDLRKGLPLMVSDFRQRIFGDQKEGATST